jgi:hypothetical protein
MGRSGWQAMEVWKCTEERFDSLATGYVRDAFETCQLYDVPITQEICNCLEKAVERLLLTQYRHALEAQGQGSADSGMPLSARQQGGVGSRKVMPQIRVMIEAGRIADVKKRIAMANEKERRGASYVQHITQHGGVMNASQTGNVSAQQLTVGQLENVRTALAEMRTFFKSQEDSIDADECVGLLAGAEKSAGEKDKSKMLGYLKQVPPKAWEIGKAVIPQVLLHYLKNHGIA